MLCTPLRNSIFLPINYVVCRCSFSPAQERGSTRHCNFENADSSKWLGVSGTVTRGSWVVIRSFTMDHWLASPHERLLSAGLSKTSMPGCYSPRLRFCGCWLPGCDAPHWLCTELPTTTGLASSPKALIMSRQIETFPPMIHSNAKWSPIHQYALLEKPIHCFCSVVRGAMCKAWCKTNRHRIIL